jgi:hypothetical protein
MLSRDSLNDNNKVFQTELDRIVFGDNIGGIRTKYNGEIYQDGKIINDLEYYNFYKAAIDGKECTPPYTQNNEECISPFIIKNYQYDIPLIMCKIGVQPQICENNQDYINNDFIGFD